MGKTESIPDPATDSRTVLQITPDTDRLHGTILRDTLVKFQKVDLDIELEFRLQASDAQVD